MITKSVAARSHTRRFATGIDYITEHAHSALVRRLDVPSEMASDMRAHRKRRAGCSYAASFGGDGCIEMEAVAAFSRRCRDPVYHLIVAYAQGEHPTREQVVSDAERLLKAIGMERNQYVLAAHKDTDNYHAHVIANRIGPNGKANDLWQERIKRERICAEIAAERGWEIVVGRHNRDIVQRVESSVCAAAGSGATPERWCVSAAHERGELPWQESARPYVLDAIDRAKGWSELHERLVAHGVVAKLVKRCERIRGWHSPKGSSAARRVARRHASIRAAHCGRLSGALGRSLRRAS